MQASGQLLRVTRDILVVQDSGQVVRDQDHEGVIQLAHLGGKGHQGMQASGQLLKVIRDILNGKE